MVNSILETERLLLKPVSIDDLGFLIKMKTDPEVMRYTPPVLTEEVVRSDLDSRLNKIQNDGITKEWVIYLKESAQPIGTIGVFGLPASNPDVEPVEMTEDFQLGYRSVVDAWGKGYITEAAKATLEFCFNGNQLQKIVACTDMENEPSKNILLKVGMENCGLRRCYGLELPYFEITRAKWACLRENK